MERTCNVKVCRARLVGELVLPAAKLVNHFRGSHFLSHKALLSRALERCTACSQVIFPRQYDLRSPEGLGLFLSDFVETEAAILIRGLGSAEADDEAAGVAKRVLRRCCCKAGGPLQGPLRCPHECAALLGHGCQLPARRQQALRPFVEGFLAAAGEPPSSCPVCNPEAIAKELEEEGQGVDELLAGRQASLDGSANVWVIKEPHLQRGKGITVVRGLRNVLEELERHEDMDIVAQKYLERPLLVPRASGPAKADLRVWVLVLDWNPLTAFAHPNTYFRVATRPYTMDSAGCPDPFAHKTNCRDEDNRATLGVMLREMGAAAEEAWWSRAWPQILDIVRAVLLASRDEVLRAERESRRKRKPGPSGPRAFELFGLDVALDEDWRPWLLEVNTSPNMLEDCEGEHQEELANRQKTIRPERGASFLSTRPYAGSMF